MTPRQNVGHSMILELPAWKVPGRRENTEYWCHAGESSFQVVLGKLQGATFTPKAYTDAEANKVDGDLASRMKGDRNASFLLFSNLRLLKIQVTEVLLSGVTCKLGASNLPGWTFWLPSRFC